MFERRHGLVDNPCISIGCFKPAHEATQCNGEAVVPQEDIRALVVDSFKREFGPAKGWTLKHDNRCGWVIVEQSNSLLELRLALKKEQEEPTVTAITTATTEETTAETIQLNGASYSFDCESVPINATLCLDSGNDKKEKEESDSEEPDAVLSLLVDGERVPIFYLVFTCDAQLHSEFWRLATHMVEGFKRMKSATNQNTIAGGMINSRCYSIELLGCDITLKDYEMDAKCWEYRERQVIANITMDEFMGKIHTHCLRFVGQPCDPFARPQLLTWAELSPKLGLPADLEVELVSSSRHTIYRTDKEYIKVLFESHLNERMLARQNALREHLFASLPLEYHDMFCKWRTVVLGPHMWAVLSEDAGEPFDSEAIDKKLTRAQVRKFIKGLLLFCLIPPISADEFGPRCAVVHGDLRTPNVTSKLRIIDFEYLGCTRQRTSPIGTDNDEIEDWEITNEQRQGLMGFCSLYTNAWQVGLLISQMFAHPSLPEEVESSIVSVRDIATKYVGLPVDSSSASSSSCLQGLEGFLQKVKFSLLTVEIWEGSVDGDAVLQTVRELLAELDSLPSEHDDDNLKNNKQNRKRKVLSDSL